jgi:N-acetylglucosamine-6-phosphate deacetylase
MNHPPAMRDGEITAWHYALRKPVRVGWENGLICSLEDAPAPSRELWVAPPLFDVQINGYGGVDFQQDNLTLDELLLAARRLRQSGCSRFLVTLITDDWEKLTNRLRHLRALRAGSVELQTAIAGWHIEGPFLSSEPGFHGAHNPALMCNPTAEHILELRTITGKDPLLLTLSPERPGAMAAISMAQGQGIKTSLGHTNASSELLRHAVAAGASAFTHLANGCPRELDRHDNIVWRTIETPGLAISLIPDQIHVSPPLFRILHHLLPADSIFYTTDAMSAAGMPPGRYKLAQLELEVGPDQVVRQPGKPLFAGSALRPIDGVLRAARMLGCEWQQVWPRFSSVPAELMGLRNRLEVGEPATFCLLEVSRSQELVSLEVWPKTDTAAR